MKSVFHNTKTLTKNIFHKRFYTPTIQSLIENIFRNILTSFIFINKIIDIIHIFRWDASSECRKQLPII